MPDAYRKQINQAGEALLKAVSSLAQITKIHMDNNALVQDATGKFMRLIKKIGREDASVSLQLADGRFYYQEQKLHQRPSNAKLFNRMVRFFEERGIFGLQIAPNLDSVGSGEIIAFFRLFDRAGGQTAPSEWLSDQLLAQGIHWVTLITTPYTPLEHDVLSGDDESGNSAEVRKSYAALLGSVKEVAEKLSANQAVSMRHSVRLVQKMVDLILQDETLFLGISTIRIYDDYTYAHSLNVAILAMCLGKRIGLSHTLLERLGLCGLFHDLGKVEIPKQLLNKKDELSEEEYALLQTHSMHSARLILRLKAQSDRKSKILVPPFEHHMGYDHSGYPQAAMGPKISLFGRILTIVDVYDAITSPRIYRKKAMSPDRAITYMLTQSGTHFDPILLKVFIGMMGTYPTGTLLKFNNGEMGIVVKASPHNRARPVVQLIDSGEGRTYRKGNLVDLSMKDATTGRYCLDIAQSLHPAEIGVQAAAYLL